MDADTLCWLSLTELAARLRAKEFSSVEVTRTILARIGKANPHLHAYLTAHRCWSIYG